MFLMIALNLVPAVVLLGGWSLAVLGLYQGLGVRPATPRPAAQRLPDADRLREAVVPVSRAA